MSLFIRCEWLPAKYRGIEERLVEVAALLPEDKLTRLVGTQWYKLDTSTSRALANPIHRDDLDQKRNWRQVPLPGDQVMYRLDLWNGRDYPRSSNLAVTVHVPPADLDMFVVSVGETDIVRSSEVPWSDVLQLGELLANQLGGLAVVTSHELLDSATEQQVEDAELTAYAAFWGVDRNGENRKYRGIIEAGHSLPYQSIACSSWQDVEAPEGISLKRTIDLLKS